MIRLAIIFSILLAASVGLPAQEATPEPSAQETAPEPSSTPETAPSATTPSAAVTAVPTATPITTTTMQKRGLFGRVFHPFSSSEVLPKYNDRKLRGLVLDLQVSPQPLRLSEVRQMQVTVTVTNRGNHMIQLDFPTDQRIEVQLLNSADVALTKWSENHSIKDKPGTVLINPGEHVEYKENIATRELMPGRVFTADVFFPKYPDLHVRQKFLTEP
jgi:hypothetical protein